MIQFSHQRLPHLLCMFVALLWLLTMPARAQTPSLSDTAATLSTSDFGEIEKAVADLATLGSPEAARIIEALAGQRLQFDAKAKKLFIKQGNDLLDAVTGEKLSALPPDLEPVRVNNRIRRAIEAASGLLTLASPDAAKRKLAADSVYKTRDPRSLASVEAALKRESEPEIKTALNQARAAIIAFDTTALEVQRISAVEILRAQPTQETLALLGSIPAGNAPVLKETIAAGIAKIQSRLALASYAQNIWFGLSLGSVLLLAAIGLAITFGVMGIINMAHGEMVMLGAYTVFVVQEYIFRPHFPAYFGWSLPLSIPLAFLVAALVGILIERGIIRFLYGRPLETLLATWGVSLILQQAVRSAFGANNREVGSPSYMSGAFDVLGVQITYGRLYIVVFSLCVFATLLFVLKATSFGLKIRAVTQNRKMAAAMGIRTPRIDMMAFALGSGIAGIAGVALSQINNVSPNFGQSYIVDSFMVVVFGGVGNLWGTFVAALSLGVANKVLEPFAGAVLAKIIILVLIILFIQKRPRGLFALKGRAVEQ